MKNFIYKTDAITMNDKTMLNYYKKSKTPSKCYYHPDS